MTKRNIGIILLLLFFLLPFNLVNAQSSNAGFVPGNIWYSKDPFEEGDKVQIYTVVFNPEKRELSGTIVFFDNNVFLGKKDFVAEAKGVKDIYIDWTVNVGNHSIFAKIENAKFLVSKGKYEEVFLAENETSKSSRTVSKKITTGIDDAGSKINSVVDTVGTLSSESVGNIKKIIGENTPNFISEPVVSTTNIVEKFRTDVGLSSENKKVEINNQIKSLDTSKSDASNTSPTKTAEPNVLLKPFKYAELFFFTLLAFIVNNPFIFYGFIIAIIFYILRMIWRLIF
ncbi:MAG: hypothetical protein WC847_02700 [Candidatus Paceibacterota bacterium]